ncbi:cAMP-dependent protein kinase type II regulatory subunit [Clonorchis sinensis]|uniref:cAMP-dependent protein kinase regulator n=2 Tax=Clonorchis sinensis TaxID=79923 RepID=H2KP53_CLOSI|nr:cAMP-dependent protein kinase type II regulatory subunit [Clonorchis sinensis]GAA33257.1 cAMP-dependent protein kinase regulator [Clonorchis sinensis]
MPSCPNVPQGYVELLQDFTIAVLRVQPKDVIAFAAEYFTNLKNTLPDNCEAPTDVKLVHKPFSQNTPPILQFRPKSHSNEEERLANVNSNSTNMHNDSLSSSPCPSEPSLTKIRNRRKSVAAEPFNPDALDGTEDLEVDVTESEQCSLLMDVCKNVLLFRNMDDKELAKITQVMVGQEVHPGDVIITQGESGNHFYVIERGLFSVFVRNEDGVEKQVLQYDNRGYFGEMALMYDAPRSATVVAESEGKIWYMNRSDFQRLVLSHAAKQRRQFVKLLNSVHILKELGSNDLMNLADALVKRTYGDGECIVKQGDRGLEMYFIMEGKVIVKKDTPAGVITVSELGEGQYFGELALLSDEPRAASVYSLGTSVLAVLDVKSFERLLGPCVAVMKQNTLKYFGRPNSL